MIITTNITLPLKTLFLGSSTGNRSCSSKSSTASQLTFLLFKIIDAKKGYLCDSVDSEEKYMKKHFKDIYASVNSNHVHPTPPSPNPWELGFFLINWQMPHSRGKTVVQIPWGSGSKTFYFLHFSTCFQ